MEEYARLTKAVPGLNLTTLDDDFVRARLKETLARAWKAADEEVKQAARQVKQEVEVTDPYVPSESPPTGVPLEDKHFGKGVLGEEG